jgi:large subunit ribosomal protein L5e
MTRLRQVKYRRRREGKTDYYARRNLVIQDKNKFGAPKFRLVVRFSANYVTAQICKTEKGGDFVVASASSQELPRYGVSVGLKNYSAGYCVGLLIARRLLKDLKMDEQYEGNTEVDGEVYNVEYPEDDARRPFRVFLDVGLKATTTGSKIFSVLKGAADGGLDIPHNEKRFPGYDRKAKSYDPEKHRRRIFGLDIAKYMTDLKESDASKFESYFSRYIKAGLNADNLEQTYAAAHKKIRENPEKAAKPSWFDASVSVKKNRKNFPDTKTYKNPAKKTLAQRRLDIIAKLDAVNAELDQDDESEDEDDE